MICPNCQTSNRADSKFCKSCGTSLSQISSPKMSPMQPGKQSFQAQQRSVEMHKPEARFQEGTPTAYRANVPPVGAPQTLRPTGSSERTAMPPPRPTSPPVGQYPQKPGQYPPPQTYYIAPQGYLSQTQPHYQQQKQYAYPPQTPPIKPPIKSANKKPLIVFSVLLALFLIVLVLTLIVFRPLLTKGPRKADGLESTPMESGLVVTDPEDTEPEQVPPPSDELIPMGESIPAEGSIPIEVPEPVIIPAGQSITTENAEQLQEIAQLSPGTAVNMDYSPDGKYVAIAKFTGLDIYDIQSKGIYKKLNVNEKVNDVVFLPDGSLLAGTDAGIAHYSANDFNYLLTYGSDRVTRSFGLSADGKTLVSIGTLASFIYKIDGAKLEDSHEILPNEFINAFEVSSDGKKITTGNYKGELKIWEVESGLLLQEINAHSDGINAIAWSPDGSIFATASADQTVVIWNADGTKNKTLNTFESYIFTVEFSPDGKRLIIGSAESEVQIWDIASTSVEKTLQGGKNMFLDFELDANGKKLIGLNIAGAVIYWDMDSDSVGEQICTYTQSIHTAAISPLGDRIFYVDRNGLSSMSNLSDDVLWTVFGVLDDGILTTAFSADGAKIIVGTFGGAVKVFDAESGEELSQFEAHDSSIKKLAISPDGKTIATASEDKTVKLWSFDTHELIATLTGHNAAVSAIAFSPDGTYLASAGDEPAVIMWDPKTAKQLFKLEGHEKKVFALAFSSDSNLLASAGANRRIIIWDLKTGSQLQKIEANNLFALDIALPTDSKSIFLPGSSNIDHYSIENGSLITGIGDIPIFAYSVWLSADGRTLISTGRDGVVRVFRVP